MAGNKTTATAVSVNGYIASLENEAMRLECKALLGLMTEWTGEPPKMWGPSIIGFGSYHYVYESGRKGDSCATGFAARKNEIALYLMAEAPQQQELLGRLGKHKMGKACLNLRRLADVDVKVLEKLVKGSVAEVRRRHG